MARLTIDAFKSSPKPMKDILIRLLNKDNNLPIVNVINPNI